jgi:hypothetical protein
MALQALVLADLFSVLAQQRIGDQLVASLFLWPHSKYVKLDISSRLNVNNIDKILHLAEAHRRQGSDGFLTVVRGDVSIVPFTNRHGMTELFRNILQRYSGTYPIGGCGVPQDAKRKVGKLCLLHSQSCVIPLHLGIPRVPFNGE